MRLIKRLFLGLVLLFLCFTLVMLTPRAYGLLFPEKVPVGYHFLWASYLALAVGLEDLIETQPELPPTVEAFKDIEYKKVDSLSLQLDIYRSKDAGIRAPMLVFIHGGGWRKGNRKDMLPLIVDMVNRGYSAATVSYRLKTPYPSCVEDIADAVNWIFAHAEQYGYDRDRIALVGASAGAHLAMMAGYGWQEKTGRAPDSTRANKIRAIVNIFGAVDLTTDFANNQPLANAFMNRPYKDAQALWREASPLFYIDNDAPPTLTIHSTSDELVPVSQADQLKSKLDSLGVPYEDYRYPLWPHAMILVQRVYDDCLPKIHDFLQTHLVMDNRDTILPVNQ